MNTNGAFELTLDHPVTVGRHVLEPGRYRCERLDIAGADLPVLTMRGDADQTRGVNIAAIVEPAFKNVAPVDTYATFYQVGGKYYFNRVYIRGLNYCYRFELPKDVRRRETQ
jgi:hypothetical protein